MITYLYQYDETAKAFSNLIPNEAHTLDTINGNALIADQGLFYTQSFIVQVQATNARLVLGTDYNFIGFDDEVTKLSGHEVAAGIYVTNTTISGIITLTYQCVGGPQGDNQNIVTQLRDTIGALASTTLGWNSVKNKPSAFPPTPHIHNILTDLDGLGTLSSIFLDIYQALTNLRVPILSAQALTTRIDNLVSVTGNLQTTLNSLTVNNSAIAGSSVAGTPLPDFTALNNKFWIVNDITGGVNELYYSNGVEWILVADSGLTQSWVNTAISAALTGLASVAYVISYVAEQISAFQTTFQTSITNQLNSLQTSLQNYVGAEIALIPKRIILTGPTTFYINASTATIPGNDTTGDGTAAKPWASIAHAWNTVLSSYDAAGNTITFQYSAGTFTPTTNSINAPIPNASSVTISGAGATTIIDAIYSNIQCVFAPVSQLLYVNNLKVQSTVAGTYVQGLYADQNSRIYFSGVTFGNFVSGTHIYAAQGSSVYITGDYSILGGASYNHYLAQLGAIISVLPLGVVHVTVAAGLTFGQFASCSTAAIIALSIQYLTFSTNVAGGVRYNVSTNGIINTNNTSGVSSGVNYFPGSADGSGNVGYVASQGQYF